eukprot:105921-Rhodomonas_salina.1
MSYAPSGTAACAMKGPTLPMCNARWDVLANGDAVSLKIHADVKFKKSTMFASKDKSAMFASKVRLVEGGF